MQCQISFLCPQCGIHKMISAICWLQQQLKIQFCNSAFMDKSWAWWKHQEKRMSTVDVQGWPSTTRKAQSGRRRPVDVKGRRQAVLFITPQKLHSTLVRQPFCVQLFLNYPARTAHLVAHRQRDSDRYIWGLNLVEGLFSINSISGTECPLWMVWIKGMRLGNFSNQILSETIKFDWKNLITILKL